MKTLFTQSGLVWFRSLVALLIICFLTVSDGVVILNRRGLSSDFLPNLMAFSTLTSTPKCFWSKVLAWSMSSDFLSNGTYLTCHVIVHLDRDKRSHHQRPLHANTKLMQKKMPFYWQLHLLNKVSILGKRERKVGNHCQPAGNAYNEGHHAIQCKSSQVTTKSIVRPFCSASVKRSKHSNRAVTIN